MKIKTMALIAFGLLATGCGDDKDVEQYKNMQVQRNLAKLEAVQGRYSGYVHLHKDKSLVGALQITLTATTEVNGAGGGTASASAQPILVANVEFQAQTRMAIIAQNSYYDPETGHYQADINIPQGIEGLLPIRVSLSAVVKGGHLRGTIAALGYGESGAEFDLVVNGESIESLLERNPVVKEAGFTRSTFAGQTLFSNASSGSGGALTRNVELILHRTKSTSEREFLDLLLPVKAVLVTLNYGNGARISFNNGNWDQRTGILTAKTTVSRASGNDPFSLLLNCRFKKSKDELTCDISTSATAEPVAKISASSSGAQPPRDDDGLRDAVREAYKGEAVVEGGKKYEVLMTVVYPARTRLNEILDLFFPPAEKTLHIGFTMGRTEANVSFSNAKWDILNSNLSALQTSVVGNQTFNLTLDCQGFDFVDSSMNYDFTCNYISTLRNTNVHVRFKN